MTKWIDSSGKTHKLKISGAVAIKLKENGVDVLSCLNNMSAVQKVLETIQDPAMLMSSCAIIESIEDDQLEAYYELWNGDAFDSAGTALLEAIADFFQKAPRAVFRKLIEKTVKAVQHRQEKGLQDALKALEKMDFSSVAN